jgi:hypothetical protein
MNHVSMPARRTQAAVALAAALALAGIVGAGSSAGAETPAAAPKPSRTAAARSVVAKPVASTSDSSRAMSLKGGEEGTVFRSLTVQGEDRIHIEVERPALRLDVDPDKAPGLDRGTVKDVLDRTQPDLETPLLAGTSREECAWVAHPWLAHFPEGAVARFRPTVTHIERWKLVVVNARAESVAVFQGTGDPPKELTWDGRSTRGATPEQASRPVLPGVSYSYVFEARDRAGNRRNFVGEGFRVTAFRYSTRGAAPEEGSGPVLVFSGLELQKPGGAAYGPDEAPPIVLEAATAVNQEPLSRPVRIEVTARSAEEANALGRRLVRWLSPVVIGDPARLQAVAVVQPDAPTGAAVMLTTED